MKRNASLSRDYRVAVAASPRPCPLEELRPYVASERGKGRTWSQIAKATGRPQGDLVRKFGVAFP